MSNISEVLKEYLKTKPLITDLVGAGDAARIYEMTAKQGADTPYIVMTVFDGTSEEHLTGMSGRARNRVEIRAYGSTQAEGFNLSQQIQLAPLESYKGPMGVDPLVEVQAPDGYEDWYDKPTKGGNQRRYYTERDYLIYHTEQAVGLSHMRGVDDGTGNPVPTTTNLQPTLLMYWQDAVPALLELTDGTLIIPLTVTGNTVDVTSNLTVGETYTVFSQAEDSSGTLNTITGSFQVVA